MVYQKLPKLEYDASQWPLPVCTIVPEGAYDSTAFFTRSFPPAGYYPAGKNGWLKKQQLNNNPII
jgi:hypothetical protein